MYQISEVRNRSAPICSGWVDFTEKSTEFGFDVNIAPFWLPASLTKIYIARSCVR